MSDDLRSALRESINETRASEGASDAAGGVDAVSVSTTSIQGEVSESGPDIGSGVDGQPSGVDSGAGGPGVGRVRTPDGKFAPKGSVREEILKATEAKAGAKAPVKPTLSVVKSPAQAPQPDPKPPLDGVATAPVQGSIEARAPQAWKPTVREKWATLPADVREEIDRVYREASTSIQKNAEAAKFRDQFQQTLAPFEAMLGGADRLQATRSLYQAAHTLNYAPPQAKAQLLARMIKDSGVPIELLDSALSGTPLPQQGQQSQTLDPESIIQQAEERAWKRLQAQQQQAEQGRIQQDIEAFSAANEFFQDVQGDMTELVNLARSRGVAMTIKQAYDRAVQLSPEVQAILKQREAAKNAPTAQAATERSRVAASSVKSQPAAPVTGAKAQDLRGALREALEESRRNK